MRQKRKFRGEQKEKKRSLQKFGGFTTTVLFSFTIWLKGEQVYSNKVC